jgi:hypothetical protein
MITTNEYLLLTMVEPITLKGDYRTKTIWLNGIELNPSSSKTVYVHSESGFDWGHSEEGAAQLALAILLKLTNNRKLSMILHHAFKNDFISNLQKADFKKTINIGAWFYNNINMDYIS